MKHMDVNICSLSEPLSFLVSLSTKMQPGAAQPIVNNGQSTGEAKAHLS